MSKQTFGVYSSEADGNHGCHDFAMTMCMSKLKSLPTTYVSKPAPLRLLFGLFHPVPTLRLPQALKVRGRLVHFEASTKDVRSLLYGGPNG